MWKWSCLSRVAAVSQLRMWRCTWSVIVTEGGDFPYFLYVAGTWSRPLRRFSKQLQLKKLVQLCDCNNGFPRLDLSIRPWQGSAHVIVLRTQAKSPRIPQVLFPGKGGRFWREFLGNTRICVLNLRWDEMQIGSVGISLCLSVVWMPLAVNDFISNPFTAGWKYEKMDADIRLLCGRGVGEIMGRRKINK